MLSALFPGAFLPAALALCLAGPAPLAAAPAAPAPEAVARAIDAAIDRALADAKVPASGPADDAEFLRRATLDLLGRIPTAGRAAAFLADQDPAKRAKLLDELLASPEYGRNFATLWQNRIGPRSGFTAGGDRVEHSLFPWLAAQFNRNRPWGELVADLLAADGDVNRNPATGFYLAAANTTDGVVHAERVTGLAAQLFLGVNLRCAQCHDHPFADWKQADFWGMAAFVGRVGYTTKPTFFKVLTESRDIRDKDDRPVATARPDATAEIPGKGKVVRARFLDGTEPDLDPGKPFRLALAAWVTSPRNEFFAKAAVNRTWAHLFGRGLVEPVDDVPGNAPTHPELFASLAHWFSASGHDLKWLVKGICLSNAYQRTSRPLAANQDDAMLYSHAALRQLRGEQLADSLLMVVDDRRYDQDLMAPLRDGGRSRLAEALAGDEDPRRFGHGVPQALLRMNGTLMGYRKALVTQALERKLPWGQALEHLYLGIYARRPTADEVALMTRFRDGGKNVPLDRLYDQIAWALLNGSEFLFNH
jgi:hypothetical protein